MKKLLTLGLCLLFNLCLTAQNAPAFDVQVTGDHEQHAILIPGFSCHGAVWESTVDQLRKEYTCHVLTLAGFAGQPKIDAPRMDHWVDAVANYIKEKQLENVSLIGHSLGGMMAMQVAAKYPVRVDKIVVVDALPSLAALQDPSFVADPNPDCSAMVSMFASQSDEQFAQMQRAGIYGLCSAKEQHGRIVQWSVDSDRATLGKIYCELMQMDLRKSIADIRCPSLILLEANFKSMDSAISKQYEALSTANLQYANQGLHFIMYDDPAWYHEQLRNFLSDSSSEQ